ncbi:MAG TPA: prolyl oligopeptidase family serine peptidase, partial [Bryobacteraceae bacterium]
TLFENPYQMSRIDWRRDARSFTFEYNQRGHQVYRIISVDASTGAARAIVDEKSPTFVCYYSKHYRHDVDDGKEVIWMSERDGWNHLYLYDGATGKLKNRITRGDWVVRAVAHVDDAKRQIWFSASGMHPGKDPYFHHWFRINFDGTGLTPLTSNPDVDHSVTFTSDMQYMVDTYSNVDQPPVSELRATADLKVIATLEKGDLAPLTEQGWHAPEVFVSKGRDNKTDIWGVIYKPSNFDASKHYPVLEYIYAGPHDSFVPKTFSAAHPMQAMSELGFIVVEIDGMGTSNRSKAFHDVAWKNIADAGFPDRILWHKAVAAKYPWYDLSRLGIYGHSAGGQSSLGALLFHGDFYKAAVSSAGCHDNRMDKISWNEQWMGWPVGPEYAASSNVEHASQLQGKLLLAVGELDTNVDPASTMQVVNALIKANKTFEFLFLPGKNHGGWGDYWERKRADFFVREFLGVQPPDWNVVAPPIVATTP